MTRTRLVLWSLLTAAMPLSGCAYLELDIDEPLAVDAVKSFSAGSHYGDVLEQLGPPTKISALPNGMAFLYEHVTLVERQYGLMLAGDVGKWIKAVYASADADIEAVLFVFNDEGNLRGADAQTWGADAGAGMSLTLIFSAGSFTDTEQYEKSAAQQIDWGLALLEPPMKTLNENQSLKSGTNGLQITATSPAVGQHSLELNQ